jgi:predicted Kef-type K+ transport protein
MTRKLIVFFLNIGLFVAGVLLFLSGQQLIAAILLVISGTLAATFNRSMSDAQRYIATFRFASSSLKEVRPLTFVLWGIGIVVVGVIWLAHGS